MADAFEAGKPNANPEASWDGWEKTIGELYPKLCQALLGEDGWEKGQGRRPPLSVILTNRDGKLKFSLSNQEWHSTYHCQVTDAHDVLGSIEMALAANQGEWVKKRK